MNSRPIRIAYMLRVHKNPGQVNAFLRQILTDEFADVYVHVNPEAGPEFARRILEHPRLYLAQSTAAVSWADFSQVEATLRLMRQITESNREYDYYCLRTGQDLIVRPGFAESIAADGAAGYMQYRKVSRKERDAALVVLRWPKFVRGLHESLSPIRAARSITIRLYGLGLRVLPRSPELPSTMPLYQGSAWFTLGADTVKHVLDFLDANPWYFAPFRDSLCADEWFFQTILLNSPLSGRIRNEYHFFEEWRGSHPRILARDDVRAIAASGAFFARKFDEEVDGSVIDYYEEKLSQEAIAHMTAGKEDDT